MSKPHRVLIAGGGVAALEALLALRDIAPAETDVELISPTSTFSYAALAVAEPFGAAPRTPVDVPALVRRHGARFRADALVGVDAEARAIHLRSGARLAYDSMLIAMGARSEPMLPGALTFAGPADTARFGELLARVETGEVESIAFTAARGARWPLPLYELALMTAAHAAGLGIGALRIHVASYEERPLEVFGPRVSDRVVRLLAEARIALHTGATPVAVQRGRLITASGEAIPADRVVALPRLRVPAIPGIPQTRSGFIPTDEYGRVEGLAAVYAAGDATWYPVKQGGLAAQQADAAAAAIARAAGAEVEVLPFTPVLRGLLLTGRGPQYLRGEPHGRRSAGWRPVAKVAGRYLGPCLGAMDVSSGGTTPAAA